MEARDLEIMTQQIMRGVTKEQSSMIRDVEASEVWDALEAEIAEMKAQGIIVEIPYESPGMQPLDPALIVDAVE